MSDDDENVMLGLTSAQHYDGAAASGNNQDGGDNDDGLAEMMLEAAAAAADANDDGSNNNSNNNGDDAAAPQDDVTFEGTISDTELAALSKSQVKSMGLSKADTKRWKKIQKSGGSGGGGGSDDDDSDDGGKKEKKKKDKKDKKDKKRQKEEKKKKKDKEKKSKKETKSKSAGKKEEKETTSAKRAHKGGGDAASAEAVERLRAGARAAAAATAALAASNDKKKKKTKKFEVAIADLQKEARAVCAAMREAHAKDVEARKTGKPPLNRFRIKDRVVAAAQQYLMHEYLVKEGILNELGLWLVDGTSAELAPVDLRVAALSILDMFPYAGIRFSGVNGSSKKRIASMGQDDDDAPAKKSAKSTPGMVSAETYSYEGVTSEDLENAKHLGWAINFLRMSKHETPANRTAATKLLERFSRVFRGEGDTCSKDAVLYATQGQPGSANILPPFHIQPSVTQMYMEARSKADPNDPDSYLRARRPWSTPAYITGFHETATAASRIALQSRNELAMQAQKEGKTGAIAEVMSGSDDDEYEDDGVIVRD